MPNVPDYSEQGAVLMLDELVRRAVSRGASDIHLEPKHDRLQVRLRIDGAMVEEQSVALEWSPQVVSRVKVLAKMDIAERRVPQDGTLALLPDGQRRVHLRASTFPCAQGEKVVLRLLLGGQLIPFEKLGMAPEMQVKVAEIVRRPQGFLVTSGPTGAGKTSTLYSFLKLLDTTKVNVVTLEDPVEVEIPAITQGQTHVKAGFTFANGLRANLRQDPDVILVGEMRDTETAQIALQAALTGHMVMSTLHTASTVETIVRLVDLGIEPWIVANALSAVLAQRLLRNVCQFCQEAVRLDVDLWDEDELLAPKGTKVVRPRGCVKCHGTGYRGRTGIFEVLVADDEVRELVKNKASPRDYRALLDQRKVPRLRKLAFQRVREGVTTIDELLRVT
jgi:type II secretory ATPase GspE/PulE/Tfp pilus assembly ATPase PilB-like protein